MHQLNTEEVKALRAISNAAQVAQADADTDEGVNDDIAVVNDALKALEEQMPQLAKEAAGEATRLCKDELSADISTMNEGLGLLRKQVEALHSVSLESTPANDAPTAAELPSADTIAVTEQVNSLREEVEVLRAASLETTELHQLNTEEVKALRAAQQDVATSQAIEASESLAEQTAADEASASLANKVFYVADDLAAMKDTLREQQQALEGQRQLLESMGNLQVDEVTALEQRVAHQIGQRTEQQDEVQASLEKVTMLAKQCGQWATNSSDVMDQIRQQLALVTNQQDVLCMPLLKKLAENEQKFSVDFAQLQDGHAASHTELQALQLEHQQTAERASERRRDELALLNQAMQAIELQLESVAKQHELAASQQDEKVDRVVDGLKAEQKRAEHEHEVLQLTVSHQLEDLAEHNQEIEELRARATALEGQALHGEEEFTRQQAESSLVNDAILALNEQLESDSDKIHALLDEKVVAVQGRVEEVHGALKQQLGQQDSAQNEKATIAAYVMHTKAAIFKGWASSTHKARQRTNSERLAIHRIANLGVACTFSPWLAAARLRREQVYQQMLTTQSAEVGERVQSIAESALGLHQQHEERVQAELSGIQTALSESGTVLETWHAAATSANEAIGTELAALKLEVGEAAASTEQRAEEIERAVEELSQTAAAAAESTAAVAAATHAAATSANEAIGTELVALKLKVGEAAASTEQRAGEIERAVEELSATVDSHAMTKTEEVSLINDAIQVLESQIVGASHELSAKIEDVESKCDDALERRATQDAADLRAEFEEEIEHVEVTLREEFVTVQVRVDGFGRDMNRLQRGATGSRTGSRTGSDLRDGTN